MTEITEQEILEAENFYLDFFDKNEKYKSRIKNLIENENIRLIIDINDLRNDANNRVDKLLKNNNMEIGALEKVLKRCILNMNPDFGKKHEEFFVGFEGSFGVRNLNPRSLTAEFIENMVSVEGIVTRASTVKQKIVKSVHYCPATNKFLERNYTDITGSDTIPSSGAYPTKDESGNILETEYGLSSYKDHRTILLQEMPESAPAGQLPRSVEVILENDLVDTCKTGDRIYAIGRYRCLAGKRNGVTSTMYRAVLIANHICPITTREVAHFKDKDFDQIKRLSQRKDILEILTKSIAPSIYGHEFIKRALLCQLMGGVERLLDNGTRIRGDINILLLGDPSVAKSQFLRYVLQRAKDRAIATTGRGSTGVGLTAAVTTDKETGEKCLEAGAMVLADRGIICIDEFDKMSDIDRTAIHEVMEQGRVSIAKAGIQAKLNARCSVLAAANPVYGRYDQYKTPMENIGLQDSLLSRFDLLFIILDQADEEMDRAICDFVLKMNMYRSPEETDGKPLPLQYEHHTDYITNERTGDQDDDQTADQAKKNGIFEEENNVFNLYDPKKPKSLILTQQFLEKYIQVARQLKPKLTQKASEVLAEKWSDLRSQEAEMSVNAELAGGSVGMKHRTQPVTVRTLETMIRLATAHAKARLKKTVSVADAEAAADLVSYVLFKEVLKKNKRRRGAVDEEDEDEDEDGDNEEEGPRKRQRIVPAEEDERNEEPTGPEASQTSRAGTSDIPEGQELSNSETKELTTLLSRSFDEARETMISIDNLIQYVESKKPSQYTPNQIKQCLRKLHDDNRLFVTDTEVYRL